jgi:ATP-dependent RNA helicase DeaD
MSSENMADNNLQPKKKFSDLIDIAEILQALDKLKLTNPTPVQEHALPLALSGKDLIVQAKTGSGKTFAFALPLLAKAYQLGTLLKKNATFALVLTPTRELANQVRQVIDSLAPQFSPVCLIGGENPRPQEHAMLDDARIVVGTPGRVLDFLRQNKLRLSDCRYFVLDEADEMLSLGFIDDIRNILAKLPKERQGLFVSATISPYIESLANSFLYKAERISIEQLAEAAPKIKHYFIQVAIGVGSKSSPLVESIERFKPRSAIIFCNTKSDTELVESILKRKGHKAEKLNSDLAQKQRDLVMKRFRNSEFQILIATDIAARGLDIDSVDLVVNYSLHEQPENYIHRTGRTGRAGREGVAVSLVGPQDFAAKLNLFKALPSLEVSN